MITRACISINNQCNLKCKYCHFSEKNVYIKNEYMNIFIILDNIIAHINKYNINMFKLGFVGNGEPLLEYDNIKKYILYIKNYIKQGKIHVYIITNGLLLDEEKLSFFKKYSISVGVSLDGIKNIHDKLRCNSFDKVMKNIELYKKINNEYPPMNCTVGKEVLECTQETIKFFSVFKNRITFSKMIGINGVCSNKYNEFMKLAKNELNVRVGGYDCTMYGGKCGAGINNIFYANNKIYICGNCIDIENNININTPLDKINLNIKDFDRNYCYKEMIIK